MIIKTKIGLKTNGQLANGEFPVAIFLYLEKGKRATGFNIHTSFDQAEFKKVEMAGVTKSGKYYDTWLTFEEYRVKADEILKSMDVWNREKFSGRFYGVSSNDVFSVIDEIIAEKKKRNRVSSRRQYEALRGNLKEYAGDTLSFKELTVEWCFDHENWHTEKGNSLATAHSQMSLLRSVINRAKADGIDTTYPFGRGKYVIGIHRKAKTIIPNEELKAFLTYDAPNIEEATAQAYFKFSLLSNGMNPLDICELRQKDIKGSILTFVREKIKFGKTVTVEIVVELTKELRDIIRAYGTRSLNPEDYIFPMFNETMDADQKKAVSGQFSKTTNKYLRRIAENLELESDFIMSKARDSFATLSVTNGIPLTVISKALGHADTKTTEHYIASLGIGQIEGVQSKLLTAIGM